MKLQRTARRHQAATDPVLYWEFMPGDRVLVVEGFVGTVVSVEDGFGAGTEQYLVELDAGMGGGEYLSEELTAVEGNQRAAKTALRWHDRYTVDITRTSDGAVYKAFVSCDDHGSLDYASGSYATYPAAMEAADRIVEGHERRRHGTAVVARKHVQVRNPDGSNDKFFAAVSERIGKPVGSFLIEGVTYIGGDYWDVIWILPEEAVTEVTIPLVTANETNPSAYTQQMPVPPAEGTEEAPDPRNPAGGIVPGQDDPYTEDNPYTAVASDDYPMLSEILVERPPLPHSERVAASHTLEWQGSGQKAWARCSCGKPFDVAYSLDPRADIQADFEKHKRYQEYLATPEDARGEWTGAKTASVPVRIRRAAGYIVEDIDGMVVAGPFVSRLDAEAAERAAREEGQTNLVIIRQGMAQTETKPSPDPWWLDKFLLPLAEEINKGHPAEWRYDPATGRGASYDWCRFRRNRRCFYPKQLNHAASEEAGYAVWVPEDRGFCPRDPWEGEMGQMNCPVSEPGPHAKPPHRPLADATIPWEQGGQRYDANGNPKAASKTAEAQNLPRYTYYVTLPDGTKYQTTSTRDYHFAAVGLASDIHPSGSGWGVLRMSGSEALARGEANRFRGHLYWAETRVLPVDNPRPASHTEHWQTVAKCPASGMRVYEALAQFPEGKDPSLNYSTSFNFNCPACGAYVKQTRQGTVGSHYPAKRASKTAGYKVVKDKPADYYLKDRSVYDTIRAKYVVVDDAGIKRVTIEAEDRASYMSNPGWRLQLYTAEGFTGWGTPFENRAPKGAAYERTLAEAKVKALDMVERFDTDPEHWGAKKFDVMAPDPDFAFHITATWRDVQAKAKRIHNDGHVRIISSTPAYLVGEVRGDTDIYQTTLAREGTSKRIAMWECGCAWASYSWGRSGRWKKYEGRMCSHALALNYEGQSRGWGGQEITEDTSLPEWRSDPSITVKVPGDNAIWCGQCAQKRAVKHTASNEIPPEPGKSPIPSGTHRMYHVTGIANLDSIKRNGLTLGTARGSTYGEPDAIWFSNKTDYFDDGGSGEAILVEVAIPQSALEGLGLSLVGGPEGNMAVPFDIPPSWIVAIHEPWHYAYHFLSDPASRQRVKDGFYDNVLDDPRDRARYEKAINLIKREGVKGIDECKFCGSEALFDAYFDEEGYAVTAPGGDGPPQQPEGTSWKTVCQDCGEFQEKARKPKKALWEPPALEIARDLLADGLSMSQVFDSITAMGCLNAPTILNYLAGPKEAVKLYRGVRPGHYPSPGGQYNDTRNPIPAEYREHHRSQGRPTTYSDVGGEYDPIHRNREGGFFTTDKWMAEKYAEPDGYVIEIDIPDEEVGKYQGPSLGNGPEWFLPRHYVDQAQRVAVKVQVSIDPGRLGNNDCVLCGKTIKDIESAKWIERDIGGLYIVGEEIPEEESLGTFPIGPDCYRKVKQIAKERGIEIEGVLTTKEFEGELGERTHITRIQEGTLPTRLVADLFGQRGEIPGAHRNMQGEAWESFKADIAQRGIIEPIFIVVDYGAEPVLYEGNHRRDAAVELELPEVPVHVRYFGQAEWEPFTAMRHATSITSNGALHEAGLWQEAKDWLTKAKTWADANGYYLPGENWRGYINKVDEGMGGKWGVGVLQTIVGGALGLITQLPGGMEALDTLGPNLMNMMQVAGSKKADHMTDTDDQFMHDPVGWGEGPAPSGTKLYHISRRENRDSILSEGLRLSDVDQQHLWTVTDLEAARRVAPKFFLRSQPADIWEIDASGLQGAGEFHYGLSEGRELTVVLHESVPPSRLRLVSKKMAAEEILHDEPEPALPSTTGEEEEEAQREWDEKYGSKEGARPKPSYSGKPMNQRTEEEARATIDDKIMEIERIRGKIEAYDRGEVPEATATDRFRAGRMLDILEKQLVDLGEYVERKFGSKADKTEEDEIVPGDPRLAWIMKDTPTGGKDEMNVADAARTYLAKTGVKNFTAEERRVLIEEGEREGVVASNLDLLDITGTHYEPLEEAYQIQDEEWWA